MRYSAVVAIIVALLTGSCGSIGSSRTAADAEREKTTTSSAHESTTSTGAGPTSVATSAVPPPSASAPVQATPAPNPEPDSSSVTDPSPTAAPSPANPNPSDFSGAVSISPTSTTTEQPVAVELDITNVTDHVVEPSVAANPNGVGLVCTADLTPDGHTNEPLVLDENFWFVTNGPLDPGDRGGYGPGYYTPTAPGQVTCEGVIIATSDDWATVVSVARLTNIAPAVLTVTAPDVKSG